MMGYSIQEMTGGKINAHLEKFAPIPQEAKPVFEDDIPVRERHFQVERFLTGVLSIVECELVKVLEFGTVSDFPLQTRQLLLKFVQRITAANIYNISTSFYTSIEK